MHSCLAGFAQPYRRPGGPQHTGGPDPRLTIVGHALASSPQPWLLIDAPRAVREEIPGTAIATSDVPIMRMARLRGIGSARVRARSSKKRSPLTCCESYGGGAGVRTRETPRFRCLDRSG